MTLPLSLKRLTEGLSAMRLEVPLLWAVVAGVGLSVSEQPIANGGGGAGSSGGRKADKSTSIDDSTGSSTVGRASSGPTDEGVIKCRRLGVEGSCTIEVDRSGWKGNRSC